MLDRLQGRPRRRRRFASQAERKAYLRQLSPQEQGKYGRAYKGYLGLRRRLGFETADLSGYFRELALRSVLARGGKLHQPPAWWPRGVPPGAWRADAVGSLKNGPQARNGLEPGGAVQAHARTLPPPPPRPVTPAARAAAAQHSQAQAEALQAVQDRAREFEAAARLPQGLPAHEAQRDAARALWEAIHDAQRLGVPADRIERAMGLRLGELPPVPPW